MLANDITERRRIEEALGEAARRERAIIENAPDVICTVNTEGEFVSVSPACLKVWGYTSDELIGRRYIELVTPEDVAKTNEAALSVMSGNETIDFENRYLHKNGSLVPIRWSAHWSEQEQLTFSVAHDITEQYRAKTELQQSESRMRALLDANPDWMFHLDKNGEILDFSAAHDEESFIPPNAFIGKNLRDVMPLPIAREAMRSITSAIETGIMEIFDYQLEIDGIEKSYEARIVAAGGGEVTAIVRNVTERKRDEAELVRLAIVAQKTQNAVIICDPEGFIQWVNEGFTQLTGYEFDEVVGNLGYFLQGEKTDAETIENIRTTMWARQPFSGEIYNYKKDGTGFWMSISITPTFEESGEVQGFVAVQMDITERKQAEEELRASEANLAAAQRITHLGSWEVYLCDLRRINNNKVHWSEEVYRIFGYEPGGVAVSINRYFNSIHPDDRKYSRRAFVELITEKKDLNIEFRISLPTGGERILHGLAEVIYDGQTGEPQKIIGTVQDITNRKLAEEALKQSERDYRAVFEQAHDAILIFAPEDEIVLDVNERACEIYGFSRSEFVGKSIETLSKNPANGKDKVEETLKVGEYLNFETVQYRKDGSEMFLDINASKIIYQGRTAIMTINRDITERKLAGEAEARYRNLVELSPAIVYLAEPHPPYATIYVSPNVKIFGYSPEEWLSRDSMWLDVIHEEDRARVLRITEDAMNQNLDTDIEYRVVGRDEKIFCVHDKGCFISDEQGNKIGWQGVILDVTETKRLEDQLRQSQKLESVGLLAGGIAHDFNNMLTAINGYSELTLRKLEADSPLRRNVEEIKKAGERSALLTHQLLAFSRRQALQPVVLDLNEVITNTIKMLELLIGEDIQLDIVLKSKTGLVNVDPGQLSQIIVNLAVNARDAMAQGGKLTIETADVVLEPDAAREKVGIPPGAYVLLSVCDTGHGMDDSVRQHIFEPFFTTKEVGRGTGLGLATVYGIVNQSGGNIEVESKVGAGTTFRIYLPRVVEQSEKADIKNTSNKSPTGTETILLVEDEELVRNLSRQILETCGYTVIEAQNGLEALEVCKNGGCKIDLLMTDVVMPQMGGRELAEKLKKVLPNLPILFTSGYTDNPTARHGDIEINTNFIQKPFTFDVLARKVRELLKAAE